MPSQSPRDYSKIKAGSLTIGNEGKPRPVSRGGINPKTGEYVKRGSLTQKPKGTFLEGVKTPRGDMKSAKTGKVIDGSKSNVPKEMLKDSRIKAIQGKKPGVLSKIKAKIYALQGKTPKGNPTRNIGPLFKTDSTKGKIPKTRQVRPRTISPIDGKPIRPTSGGGGTSSRGGSRVGRYGGSGGGLRINGRRGFGER
jgi:hypothetical protein